MPPKKGSIFYRGENAIFLKKIKEDSIKRYDSRTNIAANTKEEVDRLKVMDRENFEKLRIQQINNLYHAYRNNATGRPRRIEPYSTNPMAVKNAVIHYTRTDPLLLDYDTIHVVYYLAEMASKIGEHNSNHWEKGLIPLDLKKIVDEIIVCNKILIENLDVPKEKNSIRTFMYETNVAKRAIGKAQGNPSHTKFDVPGVQKASPDAVYYEPQDGRNIFGIKDYSLNWDQVVDRYNTALKRAKQNFLATARGILKPEERNNLGNYTFEID